MSVVFWGFAVLLCLARSATDHCQFSIDLQHVLPFLGAVIGTEQYLGEPSVLIFWLQLADTVYSTFHSLQLIDPYWTIIPCMIEAYYASHPAAAGTPRSMAAAALIAVWSLRLSHSYFRR